jgi:hypothetical protein
MGKIQKSTGVPKRRSVVVVVEFARTDARRKKKGTLGLKAAVTSDSIQNYRFGK